MRVFLHDVRKRDRRERVSEETRVLSSLRRKKFLLLLNLLLLLTVNGVFFSINACSAYAVCVPRSHRTQTYTMSVSVWKKKKKEPEKSAERNERKGRPMPTDAKDRERERERKKQKLVRLFLGFLPVLYSKGDATPLSPRRRRQPSLRPELHPESCHHGRRKPFRLFSLSSLSSLSTLSSLALSPGVGRHRLSFSLSFSLSLSLFFSLLLLLVLFQVRVDFTC